MPNSAANVDGLIRRWPKAPTRGVGELPDLAFKNARLDPTSIIAKSIAATDFILYDKRELRVNPDHAEPIDTSPIYDLLESPVKRYKEVDGYALMFLTSILVDLVGEFFWWKLRDDRGVVQELYPMPAYWIVTTPTIGSPFFMAYPMGTTSGNAIPISIDDMVWFKRMDPDDPYGRGRGTSEAIIDEVETDQKAAKSQKNLFFNDCTPPYFITAEGATQDQADAIKQNLTQKLGGWMHRREPGVLTWANASIVPVGLSPQEVDFVESRKYLRDECLQHYQIPPEIYGVIENSNRSTIDASYYLYQKNVLDDRYRFIERAINTQLIHQDFDVNLIGKFREIVPEDEDFKFQVTQAGFVSGALTRAVWKKTMGFEVDDAHDNVYVLPMNMVEIPADAPVESKPQATGEATANTTEKPSDELDDAAQSELEDTAKAIVDYIQKKKTNELDTVKVVFDDPFKQAKAKAMKNQARREAIWKSFDARATSKEGEFIAAIKKYSSKQKEQVLSAVSGLNIPTKAIKAKSEDDDDDDEDDGKDEYGVNSALNTVFTDKANKALKSALALAWIDSMSSGREHFYDMMGMDSKDPKIVGSFDLTNKLFNAFVEESGLLKAEGINETTNDKLRDKLNQAISDGITNGDTINTIKNSILDVCDGVYDEMDSTRAELIARTETAASVNAGSFMTAKASGMTQKQWLSVQDDRTRGNNPKDEFDHVNADGETVDIDEPFTSTGEDMMYPLDPNGSAGNVCQCRCSCLWGNDDIPLDSGDDEEE